jgi:hypothetical protein
MTPDVNASPPPGPRRRWPGWIGTVVWYATRVAVTLIRFGWYVFLAAMIAVFALATYWMLDWWNVPILIVLGFATFVLLRNRWRMRRARQGT